MLEIKDELCWYIKEPSGSGDGPYPSTSMIYQYNLARICPDTLVKHSYMKTWISFKDSILAAQKYRHLRKDNIHKGKFKKNSMNKNNSEFINYLSEKVNTPIGDREVTTELTEAEIEKSKRNYSVFIIELFLWFLVGLTALMLIHNAVTPPSILAMITIAFLSLYKHKQLKVNQKMNLNSALALKHNANISRLREDIKRSEADKKQMERKAYLKRVQEESRIKRAKEEARRREEELLKQKRDREERRKNFYKRTEFDLGSSAHSIYILESDNPELPIKFGITNNLDRRIKEHRKATNINYRSYKRFWLINEKHARKLEQALIKSLHRKEYPRVGNEFFKVPVTVVEQELYKTYEQLKSRNQVF